MGHDMFYMEQEVKEQIIKLDTKCKEHKKRRDLFADFIDRYVYDYITSHGLWNDYATVATIVQCWPASIRMPKTEKMIMDGFHEGLEQTRHVSPALFYQLNPKDKRIFKKLIDKYRIHEKMVEESVEEMKNYVNSYIERKGWLYNPEALKQVIDFLPTGYIRFLIISWYQDLKRKDK